MGIIQKDALRTTLLSYFGIGIGTLNRAVLFLICLTTEQIGLVNLMVAVGLLFAQMANFGSISSLLKFFPYFKNSENRHHGFIHYLIKYLIVGILVCSFIFFLFKSSILTLYIERSPLFVHFYNWVLPIGISYALFQFFDSYLRSLHRNILSVFLFEVLLRLVITFLLLLMLFNFIDFKLFVILNSLVYSIPTIILVAYSMSLGEFNFSFQKIRISGKYRRIIRQYSTYNYLNNLGVILVTTLDILMISQLVGLAATGVYSTVFFLVSATLIPFKSILKISTPIVSEQWRFNRMNEMEQLYKKVSSVSLIIGCFFFLIIWLNADYLFTIPGKEFKSGVWVFFFLMVGRLTDMFCGINGLIFSTSKKYKYEVYFTGLMIVIIYLLNLFLIPKFGIVGAAISTAIAIILYNFGRVIFIYKVFNIKPFKSNQSLIVITGFITYLAGKIVVIWVSPGLKLFFIECSIIFILFLLPIYLFKIEKEVVDYINKIIFQIKNFLSKR
jgi:O-antigen/teichoic acid export membrane protein